MHTRIARRFHTKPAIPLLLSAGLLALLVPHSAFPQVSENMTLLGSLDVQSAYTDIWGYTADGREIAIMGDEAGTDFIDVTDPATPFTIARIPGPTSTWRDMKTCGEYCYIVTEGGVVGMQKAAFHPLTVADAGL